LDPRDIELRLVLSEDEANEGGGIGHRLAVPIELVTTVLSWPFACSSARRLSTSLSAWRWVTNKPNFSVPARTDHPYWVGSTKKLVGIRFFTIRKHSMRSSRCIVGR
jgi:hypothetical protein